MKTFKNSFFCLALAVISFAACTNKEEEVSVDSSGIENQLSKKEALDYVRNYRKHAGNADSALGRQNLMITAKNKPNTRAIWFSLDQLEKLVAKVREEKGDGIRFYLATYNTQYPLTDKRAPKAEYWGYNTLVMVSTKDSVGKDNSKVYHRDYYSDVKGGKNGRGFIVGSIPENRGEICPPPRSCDSIGATLIDRNWIGN